MRLHWNLLRWQVGSALPAAGAALPVALLYVLFTREPLVWNDGAPGWFILLHSRFLMFWLGRSRTSGFAFLYTRGYSRDALWLHTMLTHVISILLVWLPAALAIWLGMRSGVQDHLYNSPYYPLMMPRESAIPWMWLGEYALLLPVFHYAWIRNAQPTRGQGAGYLLLGGLVIAGIIAVTTGGWFMRFQGLVWAMGSLASGSLLAGGLVLHRRLEIGGPETGSGPAGFPRVEHQAAAFMILLASLLLVRFAR
jgi:hypothetical protein